MLPKVEDVQSRAIDRAGDRKGLAEAAALPAWLPDARGSICAIPSRA